MSNDAGRRRTSIWVLASIVCIAVVLFALVSTACTSSGEHRPLPSLRNADPARFLQAAPPPNATELCFIVRTMPSHARSLPALVFSIAASAEGVARARIILVRSLPRSDADGLDALAESLNALLPGAPVSIAAADGAHTRKHYPDLLGKTYAGDYGFVVTDLALEEVLAQRAAAAPGDAKPCELLVVTNGDNLYAQGFVPAVVHALTNGGAHVAAVNFVSRYEFSTDAVAYSRSRGVGPQRPGPDVEFLSFFEIGLVDLGAAAFRADTIEDFGLRFITDRLVNNPRADGIDLVRLDGSFFERLVALPGVRPTLIDRTLFVHQ